MTAVLASGFASSVARADPAPPPPPVSVNLLRWAPTTVAVSSSVANAAILPEHLVDGDLKTAWNSRTNEADAWIAVRVPAAAHVTAIKLTAGFTQGALFRQNLRVRSVRVTHAGKTTDYPLDIASRALQTLAVDTTGGDFKIQITGLEPGTKATWRETCVSELEVWGTIAASKPVASKPVVRIGSLDALPAPSFAECLRAVFPSARAGRIGDDPDSDPITAWSSLGIGKGLAICQIEHAAPSDPDTTQVELAEVRQAGSWKRVGAPTTLPVTNHEGTENGYAASVSGWVEVEPFALTQTETAVLVSTRSQAAGMMYGSDHSDLALDRLTAAGLQPVLHWSTGRSTSEESTSTSCVLAPPPLGATLPPLELACTHTESDYHHLRSPEGTEEMTETTTTYRWDGATYAPAP